MRVIQQPLVFAQPEQVRPRNVEEGSQRRQHLVNHQVRVIAFEEQVADFSLDFLKRQQAALSALCINRIRLIAHQHRCAQ